MTRNDPKHFCDINSATFDRETPAPLALNSKTMAKKIISMAWNGFQWLLMALNALKHKVTLRLLTN
ncbi:MAG: hypothetical protein JWO95_2883 [Verrucomicrobiales bacterium]|nr:hypothetical protein [Verrucomicrobiales bacterium]